MGNKRSVTIGPKHYQILKWRTSTRVDRKPIKHPIQTPPKPFTQTNPNPCPAPLFTTSVLPLSPWPGKPWIKIGREIVAPTIEIPSFFHP